MGDGLQPNGGRAAGLGREVPALRSGYFAFVLDADHIRGVRAGAATDPSDLVIGEVEVVGHDHVPGVRLTRPCVLVVKGQRAGRVVEDVDVRARCPRRLIVEGDSRPTWARLSPCAAKRRSTTFCVAMPA